MTPDDMDIWIKKYVDGSLNASELEAFEHQLLTDPQLKLQLQDYQRLSLLVKEQKLLDIKKMAGQAQAKYEKKQFLKKAAIATIVLAVITVALVIGREFVSKKTLTTEAVSSSYNMASTENLPALSNPLSPNKEKTPRTTNSIKSSNTLVQPALAQDSSLTPYVKEPELKPNVVATETHTVAQADEKSTNSTLTRYYDCSNTVLTAKFDILSPCQGEATGIISYKNVQGGQEPYTAQLYNAEKSPLSLWNELAEGKYYVLFSDARNCQTWQHVIVEEKVCNSHHVFNPNLNETWEIPSKGKKGQLKIVDKKGNIYFSKNLIPSEIAFWDGKSDNGEIKTGYYLFYIQHEDNTLTSGSVTIIE